MPRMVEIVQQALRQIVRLHLASHLIDGLLTSGIGSCRFVWSCLPGRTRREDRGPRFAADLAHKPILDFCRAARSKPDWQRGPVFMDVQKQVLAACVQFTAMTNSDSRRSR
ncbi:MAG: hypothetical protein U0872_10885 [Planctomycetaceae bacterium]